MKKQLALRVATYSTQTPTLRRSSGARAKSAIPCVLSAGGEGLRPADKYGNLQRVYRSAIRWISQCFPYFPSVLFTWEILHMLLPLSLAKERGISWVLLSFFFCFLLFLFGVYRSTDLRNVCRGGELFRFWGLRLSWLSNSILNTSCGVDLRVFVKLNFLKRIAVLDSS